MRVANYLSSKEYYSWEIVSFEGPDVVASNGVKITAGKPIENLSRKDMIFVVGSWD